MRRQDASRLAESFHGVLPRRALRDLGVDHRMVRREVAAGRWRLHGRQTVALHTGPLDAYALGWRAIWEVGEDVAVLDGVSALRAAGMTGFDEDRIHVSVVHRHDIEPVPGVVIHKLIRRSPVDLAPSGVPRARPAVAAIHAAHWAVTDRQAALILCLPVQQRLCSGAHLLRARRSVHGRTRRAFIDGVVRDIADGAESLGELDFAGWCRIRGLPEPERQVLARGPNGRIYLDVRWRNGLVVEVDGSGHRQGLSVADDNLRANAVTLADDTVLRIDLVGLRLFGATFLDQVYAGWQLCESRRWVAVAGSR